MILTRHLKFIPRYRYQADTEFYINAINGSSLSVKERSLQHFDKFIRDCKEAGFFYRLQAIFPFLGTSLAAAMIGIKPGFLHQVATAVNLVEADFDESTGLTGNGTTKYVNTNLNASTWLAANDCHIAVYHRADSVLTGNRILAGAADASHQYFLGALIPANGMDGRLGQTVNVNGGGSLQKGFHVVSRNANNNLKIFRNGAPSGTNASATTGVPPNQSFYIAGHNNAGLANSFINTPISFMSIGQSLTDQQMADYYALVQTLQTNLGRAV